MILKLTSFKPILNSRFLQEPRYSPNHKRVLPAENPGITEVLQVIIPTLTSIEILYPPQPIPLCVVKVKFLIINFGGWTFSSGIERNLVYDYAINIGYKFFTIMTLPGPAFQECTGSCHENVPAPKVVSSNL